MKACYIAVYRLHGANKMLGEAQSTHVSACDNPKITAALTSNPEPYFLHIDTSSAVGTQLLKGLFSPDKKGTCQERLSAEIEEVKARRAKRTVAGVYLVFDGEVDIPEPDVKTRRDIDEFAISMNGVSKADIRKRFVMFVQSVLTALGLSLPLNADHRIEKVGEVVYLVDPVSEKPIYTFTLTGGSARISVSAALTQEAIAEAAALATALATALADDWKMSRSTSLLITSLEAQTDELQAFISAWSAMEIFINASFKSTYEARWFEIMEDGAPDSAKPVFRRFKEVMKDKYRLADKFLVIASVLDADSATVGATEFCRLKDVRDGLLHARETQASPLPTEAVQILLLKYMKLHFTAMA